MLTFSDGPLCNMEALKKISTHWYFKDDYWWFPGNHNRHQTNLLPVALCESGQTCFTFCLTVFISETSKCSIANLRISSVCPVFNHRQPLIHTSVIGGSFSVISGVQPPLQSRVGWSRARQHHGDWPRSACWDFQNGKRQRGGTWSARLQERKSFVEYFSAQWELWFSHSALFKETPTNICPLSKSYFPKQYFLPFCRPLKTGTTKCFEKIMEVILSKMYSRVWKIPDSTVLKCIHTNTQQRNGFLAANCTQ